MHARTGIRPVLFLDVDGVLNAVCHEPPTGVWADYTTARATTDGHSLGICYSPSVINMICDWHSSMLAEVRWLTTWEDTARDLGNEIGLPLFDVAGRRREVEDDLTFGWWKLAVVCAFTKAEPGRPFVWVDDDLPYDYQAQEWLTDLATPHLAIAPKTGCGLTCDELTSIDSWLEQYAQEVAS